MITRTEIHGNKVLSLFWKTRAHGRSCKRGYLFSQGKFWVGLTRGTDTLKSISRSGTVDVRINGGSQTCRPKVIDDVDFTRKFLKKQAERLAGRVLGPNSKLIQNLDRMTARYVVVELKPVMG